MGRIIMERGSIGQRLRRVLGTGSIRRHEGDEILRVPYSATADNRAPIGVSVVL